jgi:hypothetical protein
VLVPSLTLIVVSGVKPVMATVVFVKKPLPTSVAVLCGDCCMTPIGQVPRMVGAGASIWKLTGTVKVGFAEFVDRIVMLAV